MSSDTNPWDLLVRHVPRINLIIIFPAKKKIRTGELKNVVPSISPAELQDATNAFLLNVTHVRKLQENISRTFFKQGKWKPDIHCNTLNQKTSTPTRGKWIAASHAVPAVKQNAPSEEWCEWSDKIMALFYRRRHHHHHHHHQYMLIMSVPVLIILTYNIFACSSLNLLKPTGYVMHQHFNIQQLYALPTLYLCVLYLSENRQGLTA